MGNKFENICSCDTYCLNKEIKTDPNEVNEEGSMLKKRKTAQFNQYKVSNVIKETISSTRRLKNSDENMILLNTAKNTNTISSNKDLSFNSSLSCITINSCFSENIEEEEEKEKENKLELKKEDNDDLNLNLIKSVNNNFKKTLFNKTSIISIKKFKKMLTLPIEKDDVKEESQWGDEKEESKEIEVSKEDEKEIELKNEVITYEGEVCNFMGELTNRDPLSGKGKLILNSGKIYEGHFINGKLNKFGKYIDENGNIFEGYFQDGILNGKGTIIKRKLFKDKKLDEIKYFGNIKNFLKEGKGKETCKEYNYEGDFHNDMRDGKGRIKYLQTGDTYEGDFKNDKITGCGTYIWKNKCQYTGNFLNGEMNGKGKFTWPSGSEYEGDYVNGIREGSGKFTWSNGKVFKGDFKKGKPKGKGFLEYGGNIYIAVYKNGSFKKFKGGI